MHIAVKLCQGILCVKKWERACRRYTRQS